ncbi:MAG: terminase TerL endonuclease subunit [Bacillota bacterium]
MPIDQRKADDHIEFIELLKHTGDFYGQPFTLLPWQHEIISDVYGTVKANGFRQYRYVYLEVPKKNGKTELVAGIGLDHLTNDPPGGQIYCCAADRDQAGLVYNAAKAMIEQDEDLSELLSVVDSKKTIINLETGTFLRVLSAEAFTKHGINPTVVIFDELHAQPNRDLWDVMTFGAGAARKEPLWWIITTAGDDPDRKSIGWEIHEQALKIRDGELIDPTWYVKIYGAPEDADIYDEAVWYEANPSLGVAIDIEAVRLEAIAAKNSPAVERNFRWLRLNQWVALKRIGWLPIVLWDKTQGDWARADMAKKRCYVGVDLSSTIDLAALAPLFPPQKGIKDWRFDLEAFIPEANIAERVRRDHVPYDRWVADGYLNATPGDVIDYAAIAAKIEEFERQLDVRFYCADKWHLEILRQLLPRGIQQKFIEIPQTMMGMSAGMKELERLFRSGQISHPEQPLGRWAFGNVIVATDGNENIKPMKDRSLERIDPTVALISAMAGAIRLEGSKKNVYADRGVVVI